MRPSEAPHVAASGPSGSFASAVAVVDSIVDRSTNPGDDPFLARVRLRMQLHRLSDAQIGDPAQLRAEVDRVVTRIRREQDGWSQWLGASVPAPVRAADCALRRVPEEWVLRLCERFHYVGTPRDGVAIGLYPAATADPADTADTPDSAPPATLLLFSELSPSDRELARRRLGADIPAVLLSRVYSFRWAPKNGFSYSWRRALPMVREAFPSAEILLTHHDPNPGFTAASYRAANWISLGQGRDTVYRYLAGEYITDRELTRRFGGDAQSWSGRLGDRLARSQRPLLPHELWAFPLTRSLGNRLRSRPTTARTGPW